MREMARGFYAGMAYADLSVFALVLFMVLFTAVVVRLFVFKKSQDFDPLAALPLADDSNEVQP